MKLLSKKMPKDFKLYLISDTHVGSINCHISGIEAVIKKIKKERNSYAIILGDLAEAITVDDYRFDIETCEDVKMSVPLLQYKRVTELFKPIAKKILYINDGNHDYKTCTKIGNMVRDEVCASLNVTYGTYTTKFTVCDEEMNPKFKIFTSHGFGSVNSSADDPVRRKSNMQLSLKRKLSGKSADCVLMAMGHTHKLLVSEPAHGLYLTDNGKDIKQHYLKPGAIDGNSYIHPDHRYYCNTGSFLKLYDTETSGYAERFGYDPVELGYIVATINNYTITKVETVVI